MFFFWWNVVICSYSILKALSIYWPPYTIWISLISCQRLVHRLCLKIQRKPSGASYLPRTICHCLDSEIVWCACRFPRLLHLLTEHFCSNRHRFGPFPVLGLCWRKLWVSGKRFEHVCSTFCADLIMSSHFFYNWGYFSTNVWQLSDDYQQSILLEAFVKEVKSSLHNLSVTRVQAMSVTNVYVFLFHAHLLPLSSLLKLVSMSSSSFYLWESHLHIGHIILWDSLTECALPHMISGSDIS